MLYGNLFDNDTTVTKVAPSELLHDCTIHCAVYIAIAYELVSAVFHSCEEERNCRTKNNATYVTKFNQVTTR